MSFCFSRTRRVLALSTASVVAGISCPTIAGASSQPPHPANDAHAFSSILRVRNIIPNPQAIAANSPSGTASPLSTAPINGFIPQVVFGLSNEEDNDLDNNFSADLSSGPLPGTTLPLSTPGAPHYDVATFDTGSSSHVITLDAFNAFDLSGANLEGDNTATLAGSSGTETVDVSDTLGVYVTGLANATVGAGGTLGVKPQSLRGQFNVSILSTEGPPSVIPNIIGSPMVAQYQTAIRNSQTRSLTINGAPITTPQIEFNPVASNGKVPGGYSRLDLNPQSPSGVQTPPPYFPSLENLDRPGDNPALPTWWAALMASGISASHTTDQTRSFSNNTFLMDTGAQVTVFSQNTAASVGFYTGGENPSTPDFFVDVGGAGGVVDHVPGFYLDQFSINTNGAPITWQHVPVIVLDLIDPSDGTGFVPGIIGMNLFTDRDLIVNGGQSAPYLGIGPQFREWASSGSGNWSDASMWTNAKVPNAINAPAVFRSAITAPAAVHVDSNFTAGSLTFDSANSYTLDGSGRITLQTSADSSTIVGVPASIWVGSGTHAISAPMTFASDTTITTDSVSSGLIISSDVSAAGKTITKLGPGALVMKNVRSAGLNVNAGKLAILPNGSSSGVSHVGSLAIASGARLDLTNNKLIVASPGQTGTWNGSQYTGISGLVQSARGSAGDWSGTTGITSSTAANDSNKKLYALGVAKASDILAGISDTQTGTFAGQTVTGSDTLVMFTYGGDANLDGKINIDDYGLIDSHVGQSGSAFGWHNGDFNYDGKINIDDYGIIDGNIGAQGPPISTSGQSLALIDGTSGITMVPEPGALASLLGFLSVGLTSRRRRRIH